MEPSNFIKKEYRLVGTKENFQQQLITYFNENQKHIVFLNSNDEASNLLAVSNSDMVTEAEWQFGFISYDYKNRIEQLSSQNFDGIGFPEIFFFTPDILFEISNTSYTLRYNTSIYSSDDIDKIISETRGVSLVKSDHQRVELKPRVTKEEYLQNVIQLKDHIKRGDIYEVNYCQEFYAEDAYIHPVRLYFELNTISPAPFSCFVKCGNKYLLSASLERFINKKHDKIISQPIKGTIKRGGTEQEDASLKKKLSIDEKERNENIMIVDLVRNDLSKISKRNAVQVEELCAIHTFPQVHQMISTVSALVEEDVDFYDIIEALFPMGSMTGVPKVRAMELIEQYESTKRGLYSGTVGYMRPNADFDFNVVIRSLLYNQEKKYLSFMVGGAITDKSDPEREYEECMLKAKAIMEVLVQ